MIFDRQSRFKRSRDAFDNSKNSFRLTWRTLSPSSSHLQRDSETQRPRWRTPLSKGGVPQLKQRSTPVRRRPETSICFRSQAQHRFDLSEVGLFSRIRNAGPFIAALRPALKMFFSDKFAQHCGHASRMCGIASSKQSIHYFRGRCIAIFCPDDVDHGIRQSLVLGNGLSQKRFKNSDGLPKLCPLALQGTSCLIERVEFFFSVFKRPLICGFHFTPSNNQQYRRVK